MKTFDGIKNNKEEVLDNILWIEKSFNNLDVLSIDSLDPSTTAVVYVDIVHGFVDEGALSSERALDILAPLKALDQATEGFHKIFFKDTHDEDSVEFNTYPEHCVVDTSESDLMDVLETSHDQSVIIEKNSVNGFVAPKFQQWLENHTEITNFIIVGLVTDICVMNFALTLKAYFNEHNIESKLIVPVNCVETFDLQATNHHGDLMNLFALYNMEMNGIELKNYNY